MNELDHINHRYKGAPGEEVTISITAQDTTHMVNYTLNGGASQELAEGTPLRFNLKNASGQVTPLQIDLDFDAEGSYEIVVENVQDCSQDPGHTGKCSHTREGPPRVIENFKFSVA